MAKAIQKITLDRSQDIPFDKLELSQKNVRNIKAGVSIEDIANDIALRGLLMSLNVRPILGDEDKETGRYEVPAGGRRFRALELLIKQKRMAKTEPIPCIVKRGGTTSAEDDSLAENIHRLQLHPLDQFRAFQTLHLQGLGEEEIAARYFVSVSTVRQRLRLASVSPRLLDLYENDEMKLEQVMAFSITNDHVRQEQVWDTVSRSPVREPYYIRRLLTETAIRAADRRAVYVGIEAYEDAGGVVMRDLFEQDQGGWLQDPALLEQLVFEKLKSDAEALKAEEGWKWVDAAIDFPYGHTSGLRRFYGERIGCADVSFDLANGEVAGLVALEGQGQDELFGVLAGSIRPSGGTVEVDGERVSFGHPADAIRRGIAYVPGDRSEALLGHRSVRENIALPFSARLRDWGPIKMRREQATVEKAIERLQIDTRAQREVLRLSGGNQQKVTIARWVAADARTILCFDPTRGIDVGTKREIYRLLRELAGQGHSVLYYTSELEEVQLVCDRAIVIFGGRVVDILPVAIADEAALTRAAYGLSREVGSGTANGAGAP